MNKISMLMLAIVSSIVLQATQITLINNSKSIMLLSDHHSSTTLLMPDESYTFNHQSALTTYIYLEATGSPKKYNLTYRVKENFTSKEEVTITYQDIVTKKIELLYPEQFSITHQMRLALEQQQAQRQQEIQALQHSQPYQQQGHKAQPQANNHHFKKSSQHQGSTHQAVLNSLIDQYNQIQQQRAGANLDHMFKPPVTAHKPKPYQPSSSSKEKAGDK